ncbi:hypothetical protein K435DRAFT_664478 [Dendrothele bispora CBS 962.96]|uniref:Uncharacterized protein n=1 Tax=Dendrothele bispora (strain CBS 962.96) TaxID=1314807 RepID=A0A4S8M3Z2_DENBC|nr:hypothetical protein K435DRAFT_664478 [Dendrothele bispora CBS 962.96]
MVQALRRKGDKEGEVMWQYVLNCLGRLRHEGMSDEEDAVETTLSEGRETRIQVRHVTELSWRHPSFRRLFEMVDRTREVEDTIFSRQGRPPIKRIRVDANPAKQRSPPTGLPTSFFEPGHLQELAKYPYQIDDLKLSKKDFPLHEVPDLPDF